jgi:phosphotransferase system enzyme I (PtsP)
MLAVDRTNEKVADFYLPHHPSILRALKKVVDAAALHQKDVSICGDMVHDPKYIPYFLGIGIRKISIDSRYFPKIKSAIAAIDLGDAIKETELLLTKNRISEIAKIIEKAPHS